MTTNIIPTVRVEFPAEPSKIIRKGGTTGQIHKVAKDAALIRLAENHEWSSAVASGYRAVAVSPSGLTIAALSLPVAVFNPALGEAHLSPAEIDAVRASQPLHGPTVREVIGDDRYANMCSPTKGRITLK